MSRTATARRALIEPRFTLEMSERQARNLHRIVDSHCQSLKNWIASAVEHGKYADARRMAAELREFRALFAATNIDAKMEWAAHTGEELKTLVVVADRSSW